MFTGSTHGGRKASCALRALRLSLNTPVVAIHRLPVGPASAGVAILDGPEGRSLLLAVRSVRTGQVLFFTPDEDLGAPAGSPLALDAALSFGEGMGFLFDDDLLAGGGDPSLAARRWAELRAGAPEEPAAALPAGGPLPALSKFRLRPPVARAAERAPRSDGTWLRLLSRF